MIDNFLTEEKHKEVYNFLNNCGWSYGKRSNPVRVETPTFFQKRFGGNPISDYYTRTTTGKQYECEAELDAYPIIKELWEKVKLTLPGDYILTRCYANGHPYGNDGVVHEDSVHPSSLTAMYYPALIWLPDWGGETLFFHSAAADGIVEAIYPQPNRLVTFPGTIPHVARGISRLCPVMRMTLVFKVEPTKEQFLKDVHAGETQHSNGTLLEHLHGTRAILQKWNMPQYLCDAGLYHSIYGTNSFHHKSHPLEDRETIKHIIGDEAENLVYRFCTATDRPEAFMSMDPTLHDLKVLEIANLLEQGGAEATVQLLLKYLPASHPAKALALT